MTPPHTHLQASGPWDGDEALNPSSLTCFLTSLARQSDGFFSHQQALRQDFHSLQLSLLTCLYWALLEGTQIRHVHDIFIFSPIWCAVNVCCDNTRVFACACRGVAEERGRSATVQVALKHWATRENQNRDSWSHTRSAVEELARTNTGREGKQMRFDRRRWWTGQK